MLFCFGKAAVDLPDWLTSADAWYYSGRVSNTKVMENLSIHSFKDKTFQKEFEAAVESNIPMEACVLLGNAFLQREAIVVSNCLFRWGCYPTYYGSDVLFSPETESLTYKLLYNAQEYRSKIDHFAEKLAGFASRYPDVQFKVIITDRDNTSEANPAYELSSNPLGNQDVAEIMRTRFASVETVDIIDCLYENAEQYYEKYYTSDLHWNGFGVLDAYNAMRAQWPEELGHAAVVDGLSGFDDLRINGSCSRSGLDPINEVPFEPIFNLESLTINLDGPPPVLDEEPVAKLLSKGAFAEFDFYQSWFGPVADTIIKNSNEADSNALIICDSFGTALRYLIAENYSSTYVHYDIHAEHVDNEPLEQRLDASDCNTVYFIGSSLNYINALKNTPDYFD